MTDAAEKLADSLVAVVQTITDGTVAGDKALLALCNSMVEQIIGMKSDIRDMKARLALLEQVYKKGVQ